MFTIGDTVHYGMDGVCQITGIVERKIGGEYRRFYELHPYFRKSTVVFLPVDNDRLLSRVRPVMNEEQVMRSIYGLNDFESIWLDSDTDRKEAFQAIIRQGDNQQLLSLVKTLYERKQEMQKGGRMLRSADSAILKDAERLVNEEYAYVLGMEPGEIPAFIQKKMA